MNAWRSLKCSEAISAEVLEGAESADVVDPWFRGFYRPFWACDSGVWLSLGSVFNMEGILGH